MGGLNPARGPPTYTRAVIWARWRRLKSPAEPPRPDRPFDDLLENAPVVALLLDRDHRVLAANSAARDFFAIAPERLPAPLVEATREANLDAALRAGRPEAEVRLAHSRRAVRSWAVPGPTAGSTLLFLSDVTDLRRLETVRQEFVSNLSHELKTPITSLRLAVESLYGDAPPEARRRFARRALIEVDHLDAIIDNLRQLAEIEAGTVKVARSLVDVTGLVAEVAGRLRLGTRLVVHVPGGLCVTADRAKLAQALGNLVDNAAKFAPPGTPIEISAEAAAAELVIRVRDHGGGISPEHWDRVFERFYKVDQARSRDVPGTGLGLAITKHLAIAQGGRVWTQAAPGGGQVFSIAIPIS